MSCNKSSFLESFDFLESNELIILLIELIVYEYIKIPIIIIKIQYILSASLVAAISPYPTVTNVVIDQCNDTIYRFKLSKS